MNVNEFQLSDLHCQINTLKTALTAFHTGTADIDDRLNDLNLRILGLEGAIHGLEAVIGSLRNEMVGLLAKYSVFGSSRAEQPNINCSAHPESRIDPNPKVFGSLPGTENGWIDLPIRPTKAPSLRNRFRAGWQMFWSMLRGPWDELTPPVLLEPPPPTMIKSFEPDPDERF